MDPGAQQESSVVRWHQTLLENIADTVTVVSPDGVTKWTNAAQADTLGYGRAFWEGSNLFDLVHPEDLPIVTRWHSELLEDPDTPIAGEIRLRSADGQFSYVSFRCVNLIDDADIGGIVIAARSVDEEVKERRLRAKQHAHFESQLAGHSALIADVSHEMRAPIHAILGLTELILADESTSFDQRRDLETVQRQANALKTMVDELLDLSKLGAERVELQAQPFSPTALTDEVARAFVPLAQAKGLDLRVQIDPAVPLVVIGDEFRVRQILTNLMSNAVKYTDEGGVVLEIGTSTESSIVFSVRDTGRGIPAEMRESIFEPYTQARSEDVASGTGIGLAIARRLARMMDGDLSFESIVSDPGVSRSPAGNDTASQRGTTFTCELPLPVGRRESDHAMLARATRHEQTGGDRRPSVSAPSRQAGDQEEQNLDLGLILVVDDSEVNRMLAESQLTRLGYRSVVAESAAVAFDVLARQPIALVLMDWHMPNMDGLEATRLIRAGGAPWADVPIVAVTASALVDDRQTCLDAGMNDYLSKPVSLADLEGVVVKWLPNESFEAEPELDEHLDNAVLSALREDLGSDEVVVSVVQTFVAELDRLSEVIALADAEGDIERVRRAGHTVKSTAAMLGASQLASASAGLESGAREGHIGLTDLIDEFNRTAIDARSALVAVAARLEVGEESATTGQPLGETRS